MALIVAVSALGSAGVGGGEAEAKWVGVRDGYFVDEDGYYVIFHGANYMGMEFGWFGHREEDFARMASWGFNVVRIPIGWAFIEPRPGVINEAYLRRLDEVIGWAKRHGLYVILDMHQWRWSRRFGGCGMPDWVVPDARSYTEASARFFANRTCWMLFARVWRLLAERYRDEPAVLAYDIFNEPMPNETVVPYDEFVRLVGEFYEYVIGEIRKVDRRHIVLYMPIWGGDLRGVPVVRGENVAMTIHYYVGGTWDGVTGYERTSYDELRKAAVEAVRIARERGVPLLVGEFGVGSAAYKAREWARDVAGIFDGLGVGYLWWTYWRDERGFGLLYPNGTEKRHIVDVLARPYVRRSSAPVISMSFNLESKVFRAVFLVRGSDRLEAFVYIPERHYPGFPRGYVVEVSSGRVVYSYAGGVLRVVVHGVGEGEVVLTVRPAGSGERHGIGAARGMITALCLGALALLAVLLAARVIEGRWKEA